jgi:Tat protein secretion system quality control protein TatD with DNase activity
MQYSLFDFHRHFTASKKRDDAFYCTSSLDEWIDNGEFYSLGLLLSDKMYFSEEISSVVRKLEEILIKNQNAQIGEIGLDKRFGQPELQEAFLRNCITLSHRYNRILSIHCVKSYDRLISILEAIEIQEKKETERTGRIFYRPLTILHGFTSSLEVANLLNKHNIIISINPKFLRTKFFTRILEFDRLGFLIESDWDDVSDSGYKEYFDNFINELDQCNLKNFKDINNEYRTVLTNFSSNWRG